MQCSLIISVYNQAPQLHLVLETAARQTFSDFEILVADDGSSDSVEAVISQFRKANPRIPIHHVWHEDNGFRKTRVLNQTFRAMHTDYCIVADGDMMLHERFVENHLRYRDPIRVLCGYRGVKLGPRYTRALLDGDAQLRGALLPLLWRRTRGDLLSSPFRTLVLHNRVLRKLAVPSRRSLSGCNFSLYRGALARVNGMDESICEYGYEDYDLGHRLQLAGVKLVNVSKCCNTYHLYHAKKNSRDLARRKEQVRNNTLEQCRYGLQRLSRGSCVGGDTG